MDAGPIDEVAQDFGITRRTLYRLIKLHDLQTYRQVGDRRTYIDRDDVRPLVGLRPKPPLKAVRGSSDEERLRHGSQ